MCIFINIHIYRYIYKYLYIYISMDNLYIYLYTVQREQKHLLFGKRCYGEKFGRNPQHKVGESS